MSRLAEHGTASKTPTAVRSELAPEPSAARDGLVAGLFCAWVVLQCFQYQALPFLRVNLGLSLTPDRVTLFFLIVAFFVRGGPRKAESANLWARALAGLWFAFAGIGVASWWWYGADANSATYWELTHLYCLALLPCFSYFIARRMRYSEKILRRSLAAFGVFGLYLAFTAVCEHFQLNSLVFPQYILDPHIGIQYGRSRGPFVDTIGDGGMLLMAFLACNFLLATPETKARKLFGLIAMTIVPAVYFTDTRSVWLGLGLSIGTLAVLATGMRRNSVAIVVIVSLAFVAGVGSKFSLFQQSLFARRQNTIEERYDNYEIAWNAFKANPLTGLGYGQLKHEWEKYFDRQTARMKLGLDDGNHSTILGIMAELGLVGTIPYVFLILCSGVVCLSAYRYFAAAGAVFEQRFAAVAFCALEVYFMLSLTNDLKSQPTLNVSAFWFVGLVSARHASKVREARAADIATRPTAVMRSHATPRIARSPSTGLGVPPARLDVRLIRGTRQ
jgi:O-antigen ligase